MGQVWDRPLWGLGQRPLGKELRTRPLLFFTMATTKLGSCINLQFQGCSGALGPMRKVASKPLLPAVPRARPLLTGVRHSCHTQGLSTTCTGEGGLGPGADAAMGTGPPWGGLLPPAAWTRSAACSPSERAQVARPLGLYPGGSGCLLLGSP